MHISFYMDDKEFNAEGGTTGLCDKLVRKTFQGFTINSLFVYRIRFKNLAHGLVISSAPWSRDALYEEARWLIGQHKKAYGLIGTSDIFSVSDVTEQTRNDLGAHNCDFIDPGFGSDLWCRFHGCDKKRPRF